MAPEDQPGHAAHRARKGRKGYRSSSHGASIHGFWGLRLHGAWLDDYVLAKENPSDIEDELAILQSTLSRIISEGPASLTTIQACVESIAKLRKLKWQIDSGHSGFDNPEEFAAAVRGAARIMMSATVLPPPEDGEAP